jgi:hypothetical protein
MKTAKNAAISKTQILSFLIIFFKDVYNLELLGIKIAQQPISHIYKPESSSMTVGFF